MEVYCTHSLAMTASSMWPMLTSLSSSLKITPDSQSSPRSGPLDAPEAAARLASIRAHDGRVGYMRANNEVHLNRATNWTTVEGGKRDIVLPELAC